MNDVQRAIYADRKQHTGEPPSKKTYATLAELLEDTGKGLEYAAPLILETHAQDRKEQQLDDVLDEQQAMCSIALLAGGDRNEFLAFLKRAEVSDITDRQKIANAIQRAVRMGRLTRGWERPEPSVPNECAACGARPAPAKKLLLCARCKSVKYCSARCQKAAWATHKDVCKRVEPDGPKPYEAPVAGTGSSDNHSFGLPPGWAKPGMAPIG